MTTILAETRHRRCDGKCHNLNGQSCACVCDGRYHGLGLHAQEAVAFDLLAGRVPAPLAEDARQRLADRGIPIQEPLPGLDLAGLLPDPRGAA